MLRRRIAICVLALAGGAILLSIGAIAFLMSADLRPMIERITSKSLDRRLAIEALRIDWGNPLTIELQGLRLANADWGSDPEMVRIEHLSAEIDLLPLLRGVLQYRNLHVTKPVIVLERDSNGTGNWKFGGTKTPGPGSFAIVPKNRTQFPTLLDFGLEDGLVTYRTSSGHVLRLDLRKLAILSDGNEKPATLMLDGFYNDTPIHLAADTQSFAALRDGSVPFGATFSLTTPSATAGFTGTMTEPLDFDGVAGRLDLTARKLGDLLKIFGAETQADFPLALSGAFRRGGDHWEIQDATGTLATSAFTGTLALDEAGRAQPDNASMALDFADLDLAPLLTRGNGRHAAAPGDTRAFSLRLDPNQGTNIDARIAAKQAGYGAMRVAEMATKMRLASDEFTLDELRFVFGGGTFSASGTAHAVAEGSHVMAQADLIGVDASQIARLVGGDTDQIAGSLAVQATLDMTGPSWPEALKASRGHAVLAMSEGRVARALLERASTDLRALFREKEGWVKLTCVLGIVDLTNGLGRILPLRLRTPEVSLIAGGTVDLLQNRLDAILQTETASTSLFALRIPLRIDGTFDTLSVQPVLGSVSALSDGPAANDAMRTLPPALRQSVERNPCLH